MKDAKTIKVKAGFKRGLGMVVRFPMNVMTAPGAKAFVLQGDDVVEIPADGAFVIRALGNGDLVKVASKKTKPAGDDK